mmetsp:Transcript_14663/g.29373  ORF Transcript_14663/g.29373 Transcript_14663/m.29373 type:complete len:212 (+) Transcript_14663:748-1383(+)
MKELFVHRVHRGRGIVKDVGGIIVIGRETSVVKLPVVVLVHRGQATTPADPVRAVIIRIHPRGGRHASDATGQFGTESAVAAVAREIYRIFSGGGVGCAGGDVGGGGGGGGTGAFGSLEFVGGAWILLIGSRLVVTGDVLVHVVFVFVCVVVGCVVAAAALGKAKSFVHGIGQAGGRLGGWSGFYAWVIGIVFLVRLLLPVDAIIFGSSFS